MARHKRHTLEYAEIARLDNDRGWKPTLNKGPPKWQREPMVVKKKTAQWNLVLDALLNKGNPHIRAQGYSLFAASKSEKLSFRLWKFVQRNIGGEDRKRIVERLRSKAEVMGTVLPIQEVRVGIPWPTEGPGERPIKRRVIAMTSAFLSKLIEIKNIPKTIIQDRPKTKIIINREANKSLRTVLRNVPRSNANLHDSNHDCWKCVCQETKFADWPKGQLPDGTWHVGAPQQEWPLPDGLRWVTTFPCTTPLKPTAESIRDDIVQALKHVPPRLRFQSRSRDVRRLLPAI